MGNSCMNSETKNRKEAKRANAEPAVEVTKK